MLDISGLSMDLKDRSRWVAIIGSRKASDREMESAYELAKRLSKRGDIIVSGLAKGIDSAGHRGAIDAGGKTVAIVSHPISMPIYPKENEGLARDIEKNGCILYPFTTKPKYTKTGMSHLVKRLMERSILNAYLCPNIIIVKDSEYMITGGTKWATNYGMEIGHNVFRYDSNGVFHKNPLVQEAKAFWLRELNVERLLDYMDKT